VIHRFAVELKGEEREVTIEPLDGGRWRVTHAGRTRVIDARKVADTGRATTWSIVPEGGGAATLVDVDGAAPDLTVTVSNVSVPLKVQNARTKLAAAAAPRSRDMGPLHVKSPMPGKVVKVLIKVGDTVTAGQGIVVVEAMKMENELKAPRDGKVVAVPAHEGQAVEAGQTLATLA
jgi:biotin carboxyl carrier protein